MSSQAADEATPLLAHAHAEEQPEQNVHRTPLPWPQFAIVLLLQLAEPLTSQVIAPFAPQLIRDIGITNGDEIKVGFYVGLLHSLFFATQALTVLHWSRLSDHIGRKPVILIGLLGLSASMYCFGLSTTFWELVLSRCLNGALNGNISVIKSIIPEITDSTNLAQAYAYMPIGWSVGTTLGPFIGGLLSKPADRFPDVFGDWAFFNAYPYFLACAVPATFSALVWVVTYLFLKETLDGRVSLAHLIRCKFSKKRDMKHSPTPDPSGEIVGGVAPQAHDEAPVPIRALFVPPVIIAAGNSAALAFVEISLRAVQPVFLATPVHLGGLGLDPPGIGNILSVFGVVNGLFQMLFFPDIHDRFGTKPIYVFSVVVAAPVVLTFPLLNTLVRAQGLSLLVWTVVGVQCVLWILMQMAFSCIFIYIAAAAPNRASLGVTNGVAQLLVSAGRTIGPASATSMFSFSIASVGRAWYVYAYLLFLVAVSILGSYWLPRKVVGGRG